VFDDECVKIFIQRQSGGRYTVWTLFNGRFRTVRGDVLRVPHREGTRYRDAFRDWPVEARIEGGAALIRVELGLRASGAS